MFAKWIVCNLNPEQKNAFHLAQLMWQQISDSPGFIAQVGGWNMQQTQACILAYWHDAASHEHFFQNIHDSITEQNNQADSYLSSRVLFATVLPQSPEPEFSIPDASAQARCLHFTRLSFSSEQDCLHAKQSYHSWARQVFASGGLLANQALDDSNPLGLVRFSFWSEAKSLDRFLEGASLEPTLENLQSTSVELVKEWTVLPDGITG